MLNERDELPHLPPDPVPARWQENYFVIAWSIEAGAGLLVHCKRWPATGRQVGRIVTSIPGRTVSLRVDEPIPQGELTVGGLTLSVDEPFRSLRLHGRFRGTEGYGPLGFVAWRTDGETPVAVDVRLRSRLQPADFSEAFAVLAASFGSDAGDDPPAFEDVQRHYEQGGQGSGHLDIAGTKLGFDGLFVRDHTWGPREESHLAQSGHGFWTASALDDGDLFFNATGLVTPSGTHGVGVVVDRSGQSTSSAIAVDFEPAAALRSFDTTRVRIAGDRPIDARGRVHAHLIKYLPGSGTGRFDDNGICEVTGGGTCGFGVHEYAGTLNAEQISSMEAAEGGPRPHADPAHASHMKKVDHR